MERQHCVACHLHIQAELAYAYLIHSQSLPGSMLIIQGRTNSDAGYAKANAAIRQHILHEIWLHSVMYYKLGLIEGMS